MAAMALLLDAVYTAAALITSPLWAWRLLRTGKWRTDWPGRFGRCPVAPDDRPTLLIHAVSVGEVNALRLLVDRLQQQFGDTLRLVISTTTDTGTDRATQLYGSRHQVVRYPLDLTPSVTRFLDAIQPDVVLLAELEVWPNFVCQCAARDIPVAVINGRLSARSFRAYRLLRPLLRSTFARLAAAAVQDEAYADRFTAMGVPPDRVEIAGTMKWDNAALTDDVPGNAELAHAMGIDPDRPLIVAGSTGPGEEAMLVDRLADLTIPDPHGQPQTVQLLIAPRKPERFDEAAAAMDHPVRRSNHPDGSAPPPESQRNAGRFLLDTLGELAKAYALADLAIVGRSFCPLYGSDMIEPIALGTPTIIGPNTADFADTLAHLREGHGIIQLDGPDQLRHTAEHLLTDRDAAHRLAENGRAVIRRQQGATDRHLHLIQRLLPSRPAGATGSLPASASPPPSSRT